MTEIVILIGGLALLAGLLYSRRKRRPYVSEDPPIGLRVEQAREDAAASDDDDS